MEILKVEKLGINFGGLAALKDINFFVKEGDAIGDFSVSSIDKKEVVLEKTGGEIIRLSTIKKEKKDSKATEE